MKKVIVIVGPTGVGKTKMGVALAKCFNGEVISGDSMQIYKGMDIGTAKVTQQESENIIHHLIDIKNPDESYSVADFQNVCRKLIDDITSRGKLPIIVGGTGLYIKAALYDYEFEKSEIDTQYYIEKYKDYNNLQLYTYLKGIDEKSALSIHPHNRQRIIRAIAIYESTGVKKSEIINRQGHICLYDAHFIGLTLPRDVLYQRINERVDQMINDGLEKEMRCLINKGYGYHLQSMKAIGYKEWFDYFEGKIDRDETIRLIKQHSRQYAKRQYTWFKNQVPVQWFNVNLHNFDQTIQQVIKSEIDI